VPRLTRGPLTSVLAAALALSGSAGAAQERPSTPGRVLDPERNVAVPDVFIPLDPILVQILRPLERERRVSGTSLHHIDRREIAEHVGRGLTLGDVLERRVPGVTADGTGGVTGARPCVQYRRPGSFVSGCQPPIVIVDGVRIAESNQFFETMPLEHVESLTVLPASVASIRYGTGAINGVIQVETRSPGSDAGQARSARRSPIPKSPGWSSAYDWSLEQSGHPSLRVFAGASVGSLAGLAIALGAAGACSPLNVERGTRCTPSETRLSSLAGFTLPVLGGALGAHLLGRTEGSRGRLVVTTVAALAPMFTGYFFATPTSDRVQFRSQQIFGSIVVVAGVPTVATLADKLFRTTR